MEKERNMGLKEKLKYILHCTRYCGFCLDSNDNLNVLNDHIEIVVNNQLINKSLRDITEVVFGNTHNILTNSEICNTCTDKLVQSYLFIQNTADMANIVANYIHEIYCKATDIHRHLNKLIGDSSNVVIVLGNNNQPNNEPIFKTLAVKKEEIDLKTEGSVFKCDRCKIRLPSYKMWKQHTLKYHKMIKCEICFITFSTEEFLNAHYKIHSKVKCKICYKLISDTDLLRHLKLNHKDIYGINSLPTKLNMESYTQCVMCLNTFKDDELNLHKCKFKCPECYTTPCIHLKYLMSYRDQILNHAVYIQCPDCKYVCRNQQVLLSHVNRDHLDHHPFTCNECSQQFHSKTILKAHIYSSHRQNYVCEYCNEEFIHSNEFEAHKQFEAIQKSIGYDECVASFDVVEELVEHRRLKHSNDVFPCKLSNKRFPKECKRRDHMARVHSGLKTAVEHTECVICLQKFSTKRNLIQHMKTHGPNAKYPCRICNTEYRTLRQYRAHNRKHLGPFATCHVCGQEMRQILLKKHLTTHANPVVTCETCGRSFQNIALLKYHQKVHLESIPCPKCEKLINPARLRRHWKSHLVDDDPELKNARKQKPNLKCEQCDYKTWNNILLECHMNRHHLKIKPYVCHVCSKDFIGKHLLKKHLETHTEDKSVVCMVCLRSFANSACLKMHLRLHTGERPFTCELCGDRFRSSSIMNVHKLKKHSDKNNACPLCSNMFHTVRDLRRHVIKVHWKQKNKRFDPRELKGLDKEHYHLFHDGRRVKVAEEDIDLYMPCD